MLIYEIGPDMLWTGESMEIGETAGAPRGWTRTPTPELPEGQRLLFVGMGWEVVDPPMPTGPTVPHEVTRRQIMTGLAQVGWITEAEAEAALAIGARPAAVDAVISALPAEEQFPARMKWIGFQSAYRDDPMVAALAAIEGKTEQDIDAFFILCAGVE